MNESPPIEVQDIENGWEWAIVEIFGHRRHVGKVREEERFGSKMLRVDVPKLGPGKDEISWSSHFYGGSSIFSYTPTDQETAMNYAERVYAPPRLFRDHRSAVDVVDQDEVEAAREHEDTTLGERSGLSAAVDDASGGV